MSSVTLKYFETNSLLLKLFTSYTGTFSIFQPVLVILIKKSSQIQVFMQMRIQLLRLM
jgi:hypothetical protein